MEEKEVEEEEEMEEKEEEFIGQLDSYHVQNITLASIRKHECPSEVYRSTLLNQTPTYSTPLGTTCNHWCRLRPYIQ